MKDALPNPIGEPGRAKRRIRRGLAVWLALSILGGGIVVIPDEGPRLLSFSETHGLSLVDSVGIVFLMLGWISYLIPLWSHRASLWRPGFCASAAAFGAAIVAWSVMTDTGAWWALGILILFLAQIAPSLPVLEEAPQRR